MAAQVTVLAMTNEERLAGERIWLPIKISTHNREDETRFTRTGETAHEEGTGVGVEGGETRHVLADFFKIGQ
jgi:hypothetical protein